MNGVSIWNGNTMALVATGIVTAIGGLAYGVSCARQAETRLVGDYHPEIGAFVKSE